MFENGVCEFCGQIFKLEEEFESEAKANAEAKKYCRCRDAMEWRLKQQSLESGYERIEELFGDRCEEYGFDPVAEETVARLKENLKACMDGGFKRVTLSLEDGSTAILYFTDVAEVVRKKSSKVKLSGKI